MISENISLQLEKIPDYWVLEYANLKIVEYHFFSVVKSH
jgi:hypothetical protein